MRTGAGSEASLPTGEGRSTLTPTRSLASVSGPSDDFLTRICALPVMTSCSPVTPASASHSPTCALISSSASQESGSIVAPNRAFLPCNAPVPDTRALCWVKSTRMSRPVISSGRPSGSFSAGNTTVASRASTAPATSVSSVLRMGIWIDASTSVSPVSRSRVSSSLSLNGGRAATADRRESPVALPARATSICSSNVSRSGMDTRVPATSIPPKVPPCRSSAISLPLKTSEPEAPDRPGQPGQ